jgi:hypothetical protein
MREVLDFYAEPIGQSKVLSNLGLKEGEYFVVSAHREENIESDKSFTKLVALLNSVAEEHGLPVVASTHPRTASCSASIWHRIPYGKFLFPQEFGMPPSILVWMKLSLSICRRSPMTMRRQTKCASPRVRR